MVRRTKEEKQFYYLQPGVYTKTLEELKTAEERVMRLLSDNEEGRNNDTRLLFDYWKAFDGHKEGHVMVEVFHLTAPETIVRVRRHIQNDLGFFPPTDPEVSKARGIRACAFKDWAQHKATMHLKDVI